MGKESGTCWRCSVVFVALLASASVVVAGHPKIDVVVLKNGDHLVGEIKSLQDGLLSFKTDASGTISLKWSHIASVTSKFEYQFETTGGDRYYGSLGEPEKAGEARIVGESGAEDLPLVDIVMIATIESGFWKKLDGSIDLGVNYTQSNRALQFSFSGDASYRTHKRVEVLQWNSIYNTQRGGESASQQSVGYRHTRFAGPKMNFFGLGVLESNPAQGFDLRSSLGGGAGWSVTRKPSGGLGAVGGLVYVREQVVDSPRVDNSAAALLGIDYANYSYDHPKRTLTLGVYVFTNVTDTPRVRAQINGKISWEVIHNFKVGITITESYDSRPPEVGADQNSFSLVLSVGYTF